MLTLRSVIVAVIISAAIGQAAAGRAIEDYQEAQDYFDCIQETATTYAARPGEPLDLAIIAYGACRVARNALERILRRDNRATFVNEFMRLNERTMIEIAAEIIVDTRLRRSKM